MQWDIGMPNLGHTADSGTVQNWHLPEGARVAKGDILLTVESDKVAIEVEAPAAGYLRRILVAEGAEVPLGTTLAILTTTDAEPITVPGQDSAPSPALQEAVATAPAAAPSPTAAPRRRVRSSPLARRLMAAAGLAPEEVQAATGADPVKRRHVEAHLAAGSAASPATPAAPAAGNSARRAIARRVTEAWAVPTVRLVRDLDTGALRSAARAAGATLTSAFLWHLAGCLRRHPNLAAHWQDDATRPQPPERINLAVDTPRGVAMPAIDTGAASSLAELDAAVRSMSAAARSGTLQAPGVAPGGFSLSNLGGLGIDQFDPILFAPQVAILGLGRLRQTLELTPAGIVAREVMTATLVIDHRALDGADGARFLVALQESLSAAEDTA